MADLKPEILTHPNIPKPMHGLSPRTIEGEDWWNKIRQEVYAKYDYHCIACGTPKKEVLGHNKWLEAHEFWDIDYYKGICKIKSIEPLCPYCHNFIHSGRLRMILEKEKSVYEIKDILEHGFKILSENDLKCFSPTLAFANTIGANSYGVKGYHLFGEEVPWDKWYLLWNKKKYYSKFASYWEWKEFYNG